MALSESLDIEKFLSSHFNWKVTESDCSGHCMAVTNARSRTHNLAIVENGFTAVQLCKAIDGERTEFA